MSLCPMVAFAEVGGAAEGDSASLQVAEATLAATSSEVVASGICGDDLTWELDDEGILTISGAGEMDDCVPDNCISPWYDYRDRIVSVVVSEGVISIGDYAFYGCGFLAFAVISESVVSIGDFAFAECGSLSSVAIPTSVVSIGYGAFCECSSLSSVSIPSGVVSAESEAFSGCPSLADEEGFIVVDGILFDYLGDGGEVAIPEGVTAIGGGSFYECETLTSVSIPESVTSIASGAFLACSSLSSVSISGGVTYIGEGAFRYCSSLSSVSIPESVTFIGDCAFNGCISLADADGFVVVRGVLYDYVGDGGEVSIPEGVTTIGGHAFSNTSGLEYQCVTSVAISGEVTTISDYAFAWCASLSSVRIPDSMEFVGEGAFAYCESLSSVVYAGGEAEWEAIFVDSGNEYLLAAELTCLGDSSYSFADVADPEEWYYDAIYYLADIGVVTGYTEGEDAGTFGVDDLMERQDFLTMLWRACCPDEYAAYGGDYSGVSNGSGLSDVAGGTYYTAAVNWAVEAGISTGYTDGEKAGAFGVGDPVTFEQVVTMVARLANGGSLPDNYDASVIDAASFVDGAEVSSWARASMAWAVNEGLVTGYELDDGTRVLAPGEDVSRARVATILARYLEMEGEEDAATSASDFEYAIGDYCINTGGFYASFEVGSGDPQDLEYYEKVEGDYEEYLAIDEGPGCYFEAVSTWRSLSENHSGANSYTYSGYNCGYGVYITGYKGTDPNVVVPQQIDGVDVVCVAIGQPPEVESIDVSRCTGLKAFDVGRGYVSSGSLVGELRTVDFGEGLSLENVHLEAASFADTRGLGSLAQLRSLEVIYTEIASLDVSGLGSLEYLLCVNNEKLVDTSDLEAWLEAEGHEGSIGDNGGVYD